MPLLNDKSTIKSIEHCFVVPPRILNFAVTGEKNGFLSANTIATLTCQARGKPPPTVSLYARGRPVEAVETGLATTFKFNTSLVKEGVYTCFANNSVGNVSSKHTLRLSGKMMRCFTIFIKRDQFFLH